MGTRRAFRMIRVAACASLMLGATAATAAVRFVDGACPTSGSGASITCGASGPFRTIAEGVLAMQPGDRLNVRGVHAGFDGIYFEPLELRNGGPLPGKALSCTATARCVIQGCRVPDCPADELPTIRGMSRRPWNNLGGGVYGRTMEGSPNPDEAPPAERDNFDPGHVLQGTGYPLTHLGYAGDDVAAPADGKWSYFPASHEVRVNPIGTADPVATVYVPHFGTTLNIASPSAYVTIAYMNFEGPRQKTFELQGTGLTLSHVRGSYWTQHGMHSSGAGGVPGLLVEDSIIEYGGRGRSWAPSGSDGAFGVRLFKANGGVMRRNIVRHTGSSGAIRLSCGSTCTNAWKCETCDAPWNSRTHTHISIAGVGYQLKQTDGFRFEGNLAEDIGTVGMEYDVSRHVTGTGNTIRRAGYGFHFFNYTPAPGYTYTCNADFIDNTIEDSGSEVFSTGASNPRCSLNVEGLTNLHADCTYVAHVNNNKIVRPRTQAICGTSSPLVAVSNNVITTGGSTTSTTTSTSTTNTASSSTSSSTTTTRPTSTTSTTIRSTTSTRPTTPTTSTSSTTSTSFTTTTLDLSGCGDGLLDADEECDDGDRGALDGCDGSCRLEEIAAATTSDLRTTITPPDDPLGVQIASPIQARLVIVETSATTSAPPAFTFVSRQVHTEGPRARPPAPLKLTFTLNGSLAPSLKHPRYLKVFKGGQLVGPCVLPRRAYPNPCVFARTALDEQNADVTVLTSTTGEWNFGTPMGTPTSTVDRCLGGTKLMLLDNPGVPERRRFLLRSHDTPELVVGDGTDALEAMAEGGSLRVFATGGDLFDATYDLPAEGWQPINPDLLAYGVRYRDRVGPIRSILFRGARSLQVIGLGPDLEHTLGLEPEMVSVELTIGQYAYLFEFGGEQQQFEPGMRLVRKWSSRPAICPSDGTVEP